MKQPKADEESVERESGRLWNTSADPPALVTKTAVLKQYGAVCVSHSVALEINMCVSCLHDAVTQFSASETWLHCQGELSGGHYGPVFAHSSFFFAATSGRFYSPSFYHRRLLTFSCRCSLFAFPWIPNPTNLHRDKGAVVSSRPSPPFAPVWHFFLNKFLH